MVEQDTEGYNKNCLITRNTKRGVYARCKYCRLTINRCFGMQANAIIFIIIVLVLILVSVYNTLFVKIAGLLIIIALILLAKVIDKETNALFFSQHKLEGRSKDLEQENMSRRQTEEALRKSHEALLTVLDSLDAAVYVADMDTYEILFVNKYLSKIFGDVVGKICWQTLQTDQSGPCSFCTNKKLLNADGEPTGVYLWEFQNTVTGRWYEIRDRAIKWVDGRTVRLEIATDITERKRTEEEVQRRVKELEFIRDINIALNTDVDVEKVIQMITDGMTSTLGYDASAVYLIDSDKRHLILHAYSSDKGIVKKIEEVAGINIQGFKAPIIKGNIISRIIETQKPVLTEDIAGVVRENTDSKLLKRLAPQIAKFSRLKSGVGAPLISSEGVIGIIGVGSTTVLSEEDAQRLTLFGNWAALAIEKAKNVRRLEGAYDELRQSNRLKDLFIDIMTHDLLNPAGVSMNMTKMMLDEEKDRDKKESLQIILRSAERMIVLIQNASILAKLGSGGELKFEEVDLSAILRNAAKEMTSLADEKKMKIKLPAKKGFKAFVNPLIQDVFSNLLSNAIKYGPEKSEVVAKIEEAGPNWKISIADNGPGIPDEHKEAVFDRFKRIQKGPVKGSGLGLTIVKRVVELHKGKAWVENNPKGGSIFIVEIPKKQ
ncbi:sensor protein KdpD [archaeon BMS3Abin16]|nr:sensor protein KdpD [archaeon BMS3Abin16]